MFLHRLNIHGDSLTFYEIQYNKYVWFCLKYNNSNGVYKFVKFRVSNRMRYGNIWRKKSSRVSRSLKVKFSKFEQKEEKELK